MPYYITNVYLNEQRAFSHLPVQHYRCLDHMIFAVFKHTSGSVNSDRANRCVINGGGINLPGSAKEFPHSQPSIAAGFKGGGG